MKDESGLKKHFAKSIRAQGGVYIPLAAPIIAGVPDTWCALPGFCPVLLEVKWARDVTAKTDRQIDFRPMQKHYIDSCNKVHKGIAWVLQGYRYDSKYWAALLNSDDRVRVTSGSRVAIVTESEFFDVRKLFELYVPKMQVSYPKPLTEGIPIDKVSIGICNGVANGPNSHA